MDLSWQLLHKLEKKYGEAFYLLDRTRFETNYREFLTAFRSGYPKSNIAYSYKTNYTPSLCQAVNEMGGYAEVVSDMEYDLARRVGVAPRRIIFNGPYKRQADVEKALLSGSTVNLDSLSEAALVETIARNVPDQKIRVGLRCNFELAAGKVSRFGIDVKGGELQAALERLRSLHNCQITGLHCHFSTADKSTDSYLLRTKKMLALSTRYFKQNPPESISVGGGFFGKMSSDFQNQFAGPIPTYQEYATAVTTPFRTTYNNGSGPELVLEPGTAIVADTMKFVAKVIHVKTIRTRRVALVSGSIHNIKPTLHGKTLPMRVIPQSADRSSVGANTPVDVVGYTCMEHDCLYSGYKDDLAVGDYVVFENVGAYTTVMKPPFIHPFPPIIAFNPELQDFEVSKRQEKFSDVFSTYIF